MYDMGRGRAGGGYPHGFRTPEVAVYFALDASIGTYTSSRIASFAHGASAYGDRRKRTRGECAYTSPEGDIASKAGGA